MTKELNASICRRDLIRLSIATAMLIIAPKVAHGEFDEKDREDYDGPLPGPKIFGLKPAEDKEDERAKKILEDSPAGESLIKTARYFEEIKEKNINNEAYNAQWSERWNPVIVGFYGSVIFPPNYDIREKGDTAKWCAAFLCWCLERGGYVSPKNPMSSGFRRFGKATTDPKPGDIIVFRSRDRKLADKGVGHVGIFQEKTDDGFRVLGGNQHNGKCYTSVNYSEFLQNGRDNVLDSFRSFESIPKK